MVESIFTYNLAPGIGEDLHQDLLREMLTTLLHDKKILEFRSQRNLMGSPSSKLSIFWEHATHWAAFIEMEEWQKLLRKLGPRTTDLRIELWSDAGFDSEIRANLDAIDM